MFNERRTEPSLNELFGDSVIQLLMRRDGVTESDVRTLLCKVKDARAVAYSGTKRRPRAATSAAHAPDRREMAVRSRATKSSKASKIPLKFI